jgi:hypothetical protein
VSVITIYSSAFCQEDLTVKEVVSSTGYQLITDDELAEAASRKAGMDREKIKRAFSAKTSVFNQFTHEKERSIAHLKLVVAEKLSEDNLLITGFCTQLIPAAISHVLRVCLIADYKFRTAVAAERRQLTEKEALRVVRKEDEDRAAWVDFLHARKDPWDPDLYDLVIPMGKTTLAQASALIQQNVLKDVVKPTQTSKNAVADFYLTAKVEAALAQEGHQVAVSTKDGNVNLVINKHVLMLSRLEEELRTIVKKVSGVRTVETTTGKNFHQTHISLPKPFPKGCSCAVWGLPSPMTVNRPLTLCRTTNPR